MKRTKFKIAFLLYDSRSGSTFLSKRLTEDINDVIVTPEIGFDYLFKHSIKDKLNWPDTIKRMYRSHEFINLNVPKHELEEEFLLHSSIDIPEGIKLILTKWLKVNYGFKEYSGWIIVKNGSHLKYIDNITKIFNKRLPFIYLLRDPRAVINSKYNTKRPYYPYESMAWSGLLLTALRWKIYYQKIQKAKENGSPILKIKYEDLVCKTDTVINSIRSFLKIKDLKRDKNKLLQTRYNIPEKEKHIHQLTNKLYGVEERIYSWKKELSPFKIRVIEAICGKEMMAEGYSLMYNDGSIIRCIFILMSLPDMIYSLLRHFKQKICRR